MQNAKKPHSNAGLWGVKILAKSEVRFLVDYLCFTVSRLDFFSDEADEQYIFERVQKKFMLEGLQYQLKRSFYGYATTYNAQGVSLCFGGRDDIYIQMSGTGCRAFESLNPGLSWESYIRHLQSTYCSLHFSRLDVACDTFDLLRMDWVQRFTMAQQFTSKWRTWLVQAGSNENSVIFGAASSDFRCRIYDKTQERREKTGREDVPENWVRVEFQLRNEAVMSFLGPWQESGDLSSTFLGLLRNQLVFWTAYDGVHTDRMKIAPWWKRLLNNAGRIKMAYCGGMEYNLDDLKQYVLKQAGSSVRAFVELFGPEQLLKDVAVRPLNDRQRHLLEQARVELLAGAQQIDLD